MGVLNGGRGLGSSIGGRGGGVKEHESWDRG